MSGQKRELSGHKLWSKRKALTESKGQGIIKASNIQSILNKTELQKYVG